MNTNATEFFETRYGRRIPFISGYREAYPRSYWETPERRSEAEAPQRPFHLFQNHIYKLAIVLDFLSELGLSHRWRRALDVGAMDATISRLLAASQLVDQADAVDLFDQSERLSNATFQKHLELHRITAVRSMETAETRRAMLDRIPLFHEFRFHPAQTSPFWQEKFETTPSFRFLIGDILKNPPADKYDLVTSFMTSVVLDVEKAFQVIADKLDANGIFVLLEPYWWHPYLFLGSVGHFPYAFQRLDDADTTRYLREHHSDDAETLLARLEIFSHRWTVNDYVTAADRCGLELLGERRFVQTQHFGVFRSKISPQAVNLHDDSRLCDVLDDIHAFRSDIQLNDLLTSFVVLVFRKSPPRRPHLAATIDAMNEDAPKE